MYFAAEERHKNGRHKTNRFPRSTLATKLFIHILYVGLIAPLQDGMGLHRML